MLHGRYQEKSTLRSPHHFRWSMLSKLSNSKQPQDLYLIVPETTSISLATAVNEQQFRWHTNNFLLSLWLLTQAHFHEISCEQNINSIDWFYIIYNNYILYNKNYNNFSLLIFIFTIYFIKTWNTITTINKEFAKWKFILPFYSHFNGTNLYYIICKWEKLNIFKLVKVKR